MRALETPTITSFGDDATLRRRIPESAFEAELLKAALASRGAFPLEVPLFESELVFSIRVTGDSEWDEQGRLRCWLVVSDPQGSLIDVDRPGGSYPIYLWVAERECPSSSYYALVAGWDCPANPFTMFDQSNHFGCLPVLSAKHAANLQPQQ